MQYFVLLTLYTLYCLLCIAYFELLTLYTLYCLCHRALWLSDLKYVLLVSLRHATQSKRNLYCLFQRALYSSQNVSAKETKCQCEREQKTFVLLVSQSPMPLWFEMCIACLSETCNTKQKTFVLLVSERVYICMYTYIFIYVCIYIHIYICIRREP